MVDKDDDRYFMWADAFKLFSAFSDIPQSEDLATWQKFFATARQLNEDKWGDHPDKIVFQKLSNGVVAALVAQYEKVHGGKRHDISE